MYWLCKNQMFGVLSLDPRKYCYRYWRGDTSARAFVCAERAGMRERTRGRMRNRLGGKIEKAIAALWRKATSPTPPPRAASKLPLIEDIVARAGREPPVVD